MPSADVLDRPERHLGNAALGFLAVLAVPVAAVAASRAGLAGAVGAVAGVGLVGILFGAAGAMQAWAAGRGLVTLARMTWAGVGLRLVAYATALALLGRIEWLHRPSLAIATGVAFTATLGFEIWLIGRTPSYYWVRVPAAHPGAGAPGTVQRSEA